MPGIKRSLIKSLASLAMLALTAAGIEQPLTSQPGDPASGRAIVLRQTSTCTLCHAGPFPNPHLQGDVGPDLHGVGARFTIPELRAQLVDSRRLNPATVMPAFHRTENLTNVGQPWQGKPILTSQEIEDVVAYLATLK